MSQLPSRAHVRSMEQRDVNINQQNRQTINMTETIPFSLTKLSHRETRKRQQTRRSPILLHLSRDPLCIRVTKITIPRHVVQKF